MRRFTTALVCALAAFGVASSASAKTITYPASGLLPAGAVFEWEHPDQGRDFVTNWRGVVQAPGSGCVVGLGSDRAFPNGFGPSFPLVRIDTGPYASASPYYIGHTTALVQDGECFKFGHPLSRADQGRPSWICPDLSNCEGYHLPVDGGWVEFGQQEPSGALGPNNGDAGHWYDAPLRTPLVVVVSDPLDIFPKTVFTLPHLQVASEWGTVRTFEGYGCHNPVRRRICQTSRWHLQLLRDRDIWVAHHRLTSHGWVTSKARWSEPKGQPFGARVHRIQYDITSA